MDTLVSLWVEGLGFNSEQRSPKPTRVSPKFQWSLYTNLCCLPSTRLGKEIWEHRGAGKGNFGNPSRQSCSRDRGLGRFWEPHRAELLQGQGFGSDFGNSTELLQGQRFGGDFGNPTKLLQGQRFGGAGPTPCQGCAAEMDEELVACPAGTTTNTNFSGQLHS